jgi:hypothetical protein
MLREIIALFDERNIISLRDCALHFKVETTAMEAMLQQLVSRGYIAPINSECSSCSGHCKGCSFADQKDLYTRTTR